MQFQTVSYMKRKNMGNYEHEEVSITALIEDGENHMEAIAQVKFACHQALGMVLTPKEATKPAPEVKEDEKPKTVKATKKVTKKKATKAKVAKPEPAEEEVKEHTLEDVKQILTKVWKTKGQGIAKKILTEKFGVQLSKDLDPSQYAAVIKECEVCLK